MSVSDQIRKVENSAYCRSSDSLRNLLEILRQLADERSKLNYWTTHTTDHEAVRAAYTRLAAAISAILMTPNPEISNTADQDFDDVMAHADLIALVFSLSEFRTTDHLLELMRTRSSRRSDQGLAFDSKWDAKRFLLACSLNARCAEDLIKFLARDAQALHGLYLRILATRNTVEKQALEQKHRLLAASGALAQTIPETQFLGVAAHAWQLCSYATSDTKHEFKRHSNQMIRNWFSGQGIKPTVATETDPGREKPVLLVACEFASRTHVMQRCYGHALHQLRQRFRVSVLIAEEDLRHDAFDWCDQLVTFRSSGLQFPQLIDLIGQQQPDMIYYPIVGMQPWSIMLANLRLAPIQFATPGHPATTHSLEMDYVVIGKDMMGPVDCFSEKVVLLEAPGNIYELRRDVSLPAPDVGPNPPTVTIAVAASVAKLNAQFIAACRRIAEQSKRRLEFRFFPNATGLEFRVLAHRLKQLLPSAQVRVYPRSDLSGYLQDLNGCDIGLSPFPFGGENCALDCLLQGIPIVTLEGRQPHARLDARVMRLANAPEWLITQTPVEYEQAALRLIEDDRLRCDLSGALLGHCIEKKIREERELYATEFVETVRWIYDHHLTLQASSRKVLSPGPEAGGCSSSLG